MNLSFDYKRDLKGFEIWRGYEAIGNKPNTWILSERPG
jgi:hypothetical protein